MYTLSIRSTSEHDNESDDSLIIHRADFKTIEGAIEGGNIWLAHNREVVNKESGVAELLDINILPEWDIGKLSDAVAALYHDEDLEVTLEVYKRKR